MLRVIRGGSPTTLEVIDNNTVVYTTKYTVTTSSTILDTIIPHVISDIWVDRTLILIDNQNSDGFTVIVITRGDLDYVQDHINVLTNILDILEKHITDNLPKILVAFAQHIDAPREKTPWVQAEKKNSC